MSITFGEFDFQRELVLISCMKPVAETRRERLEMLIKQHGSIAALNEALSLPRTDPKLTQIRNANIRHGRAKPHQMGNAIARKIEQALDLSNGWMDMPLSSDAGTVSHVAHASEPADFSPDALSLARLFDLIPLHDVLTRAQAQTICGQAIIDLLQKTSAVQVRRAPDNKTLST
jgi:hypothetical protein